MCAVLALWILRLWQHEFFIAWRHIGHALYHPPWREVLRYPVMLHE